MITYTIDDDNDIDHLFKYLDEEYYLTTLEVESLKQMVMDIDLAKKAVRYDIQLDYLTVLVLIVKTTNNEIMVCEYDNIVLNRNLKPINQIYNIDQIIQLSSYTKCFIIGAILVGTVVAIYRIANKVE